MTTPVTVWEDVLTFITQNRPPRNSSPEDIDLMLRTFISSRVYRKENTKMIQEAKAPELMYFTPVLHRPEEETFIPNILESLLSDFIKYDVYKRTGIPFDKFLTFEPRVTDFIFSSMDKVDKDEAELAAEVEAKLKTPR